MHVPISLEWFRFDIDFGLRLSFINFAFYLGALPPQSVSAQCVTCFGSPAFDDHSFHFVLFDGSCQPYDFRIVFRRLRGVLALLEERGCD